MKQFFKIILILLLLPLSASAQDKKAILKMDTMIINLYQKESFQKCLEVLDKQQTLVAKLLGEQDTTYFQNLRLKARCQYRLKDYSGAVKSAQDAVDNWKIYHDTAQRDYPLALDNLALYLSAGPTPDSISALKCAKEALQLYEKYMVNDYDLAVILLHVAEFSNVTGNPSDAVKYELRALNIFKEVFGEHSDEYIAELAYLHDYYNANGQKQKAKDTEDLITKLQEEQDKEMADLPEPMEFKTVEECRAHVKDAYKCIVYYLNHKLNADKMNQAATYVMSWSMVTDQVHVLIGKEEAQLMNSKKSMPYAVAYFAGCCRFALENDSADFSNAMFCSAMIDVLNFYMGGNDELTGKVAYLDKLVNAYKKDGLEALKALLDKYYAKLSKDMEKAKKVEVAK